MHALTIILLFVSTAQAASDDLFNGFELVNLARQAKGIRPLSWDANLTAYAQFWANQMASGSQPFEHARGIYRPDQGENLYEQSAGQCDASYDRPLQTAVHVWLSQERLYAGQPVMTGHEPWLHWSQCMWAATTDIGCARAFSISEPYKFYDVCRFSPEGNM
ncbi:Basic form of pathogenesis- protein 1 [Moelleriella libera RCEF 2490]|uniref:Basic form of pathogenesis-protein 1 n=1 Tax=Moelleriella libera RCEF 2490 TaxID=1081109 RepID=A0A166UZH9_9HYPO|nr:Basic form of pathogenesis- protein 1 [Moelleriella libera RCEF 2490]